MSGPELDSLDCKCNIQPGHDSPMSSLGSSTARGSLVTVSDGMQIPLHRAGPRPGLPVGWRYQTGVLSAIMEDWTHDTF